jgi:hypothetical protein
MSVCIASCIASFNVDTMFVIAAGDIPRDHIYYLTEDGGVHGKISLLEFDVT